MASLNVNNLVKIMPILVEPQFIIISYLLRIPDCIVGYLSLEKRN